jgi:enhancing lycopene biosynthesis protein 2
MKGQGTMKIPNVAVVIAGCGSQDGAEIFETVFTLLELDRNNVNVGVFAPDQPQYRVVNHLTGENMPETRNVLLEAARLTRGNIRPLSALNPKEFDALILPGGSGVASNLSDLQLKQEHAQVNKDLQQCICEFYTLSKPIGAICIAPAIVAVALKGLTKPTITLGPKNALIAQLGALEEVCAADSMVVDEPHKLVTTPAFMTEAPLVEIHKGIAQLVSKVIELC